MKTLLMLHSTGTSPLMWMGVPDDVTEGRNVLAPTHLGYPPNAPVERGAKCEVTDDASHVLTTIPDDGSEIDVVAHSYGGLVAAKLLPALGARVKSLFLYEPVLFGALATRVGDFPDAAAEVASFVNNPKFYSDESGGTDEWLGVFIDYWNRPGSWERMPEFMKEQTRAVGWKMYQEVRSCFYAPQRFEELAVKVPLTLVTGSRTTASAKAMTELVAALNPQARRVELEKVGHMGPLTAPAMVHDALREHLRSNGR